MAFEHVVKFENESVSLENEVGYLLQHLNKLNSNLPKNLQGLFEPDQNREALFTNCQKKLNDILEKLDDLHELNRTVFSFLFSEVLFANKDIAVYVGQNMSTICESWNKSAANDQLKLYPETIKAAITRKAKTATDNKNLRRRETISGVDSTTFGRQLDVSATELAVEGLVAQEKSIFDQLQAIANEDTGKTVEITHKTSQAKGGKLLITLTFPGRYDKKAINIALKTKINPELEINDSHQITMEYGVFLEVLPREKEDNQDQNLLIAKNAVIQAINSFDKDSGSCKLAAGVKQVALNKVNNDHPVVKKVVQDLRGTNIGFEGEKLNSLVKNLAERLCEKKIIQLKDDKIVVNSDKFSKADVVSKAIERTNSDKSEKSFSLSGLLSPRGAKPEKKGASAQERT